MVEVCVEFKFTIKFGAASDMRALSLSAPSASTGGIMKFDSSSDEESDTGTPGVYSNLGSFNKRLLILSSASAWTRSMMS